MDKNNPIINLQDVSFSYNASKPVLERVNFTVQQGQRLGLIGPNGSGKTTLLHILMGLLPADSGTIHILGRRVRSEKEFRAVRREMGFLFQNADDQIFSPTVLEDVAFGPLNQGLSPQEAREKSRRALSSLNLEGYEDRLTHKLSGGEKKLVALATVLVMEPEILLLDEPTTGLDEDTVKRLMEILGALKISYVIVSHEYDFLARTTEEIYCIHDHRILFEGDSRSLHSHYHIHPAGHMPHEHK